MMKNNNKTREQFLDEIGKLKEKIAELEKSETERKQADERSFEKQKTIDAIIQNSAVATFIINSEHKVLYWNRACEELTGIKADELIGTDNHWKAFYNHKRPCVADIVIDGKFEKMFSLYKKYSKSNLIPNGINAEDWFTTLGGKERYIIFGAAPLQIRQGKIMSAIETLQDITERKQIEAKVSEIAHKFQVIFNSINDGLAIMDRSLTVREVNDYRVKALGLKRNEIIGRKCYKVFQHRDKPCEICPVQPVFEKGEMVRLEKSAVLKDGSVKYFDTQGSPVFDHKGNIVQVVSSIRDITERKQAENLIPIQRDFAIPLSNITALNEALELCIDTAISISGMDCGGVYLIDENTGDVKLKNQKGLPADFLENVLLYAPDSPSTKLVIKGKPVYSKHKELGIELNGVRRKESLKAVAMIPVSYEGKVIGCLNIGSHTKSEVPVFARNALETITSQIGNAIFRIRAVEALRESEEKYRQLAEIAKDVIMVMDMKGNIKYINQEGIKLSGYSKEEVLKMKVKDIFSEDKISLSDNMFAKRITGDKSLFMYEIDFFNNKGDKVPVEIKSSLITEHGKPSGVLITARDMTERKKMEKELIRLSDAFRMSIDSIIISDLEAKITDVNEATLKMYGTDAKTDLLGKNSLELVASEDKEKGIAIMKELMENGYSKDNKYNVILKDGSKIPVEMSVSIMKGKDGKPIGMVGITRDITERKQAEEALKLSNENFQQVVSNITTVVWKADIGKNGSFENTYTSPVVDELLELPAGTIQNDWNKYFRYIKPEYLERMKNAFKEAIISPSKKIDCQYEVLKDNGQTAWFYSNGRCFEKNGKLHVFGSTTDITESKRVEKALQESEKQLKTLIDTMPDFVCFKDEDSRWLMANEAGIRIFQLEGIAYQGKKDSELAELNSKLRGSFLTCKESDARVWKEGGLIYGEETIPDPDGSVRIFDVTKVPVFYPDGERKGIVVLGHDITERKKSEEALNTNYQQQKLLTEVSYLLTKLGKFDKNMNDVLRLIGKYTNVSRVYVFENFNNGEYSKNTYEWCNKNIKPEIDNLQETPYSTVPSWKKILNEKGMVYSTNISELPQDIKVILEPQKIKSILVLPIYVKDRFFGFMGFDECETHKVWDNSEVDLLKTLVNVISTIFERRQAEKLLRESEEKFRDLANLLPQIVYEIDIKGNLTFVNKQAFGSFGYSQEDYEKGINVMQTFIPEDIDRAKENIQIILNKKTVVNLEYTALRKDGSTFPVLIYSDAILKDNKPVGLRGIMVDITEQKQREEEVRRHQNLESIGVLAGGIAHDFNNILTIILGNITLSKMCANTEDKIYKRLVEAEKGAMRAKELTQQLLTFSKGGAPVKETSSVAEVLKESAAFTLSGSNVKCIFSIPDDIWAVEIDKGQINQVFNNLVMNADQAMPEGGMLNINAENITITSADILPLQKGKYVKFSFEDHGIGISSHHLDKIFDPYFFTKAKGSGLGLASAYSIIRNHNGLITVESELGAGTTFYIYLPASEEIVVEKKAETGKALFGKGKILIMDDEDFIREVAGKMVESLGYSAEFASDGAEAIELYGKALKSEEPFAAVIMDLTIPGGMGGKEAIKELLKIDPNAKAIVSSGYSSDPIMSDCKKYGFMGVVAKPYKISELGNTLKEIILK